MQSLSDSEEASAHQKPESMLDQSPESLLALPQSNVDKDTSLSSNNECTGMGKAKIQMRFTKRNVRKCYTRVTVADKKGKKVGRWTHTEHLRFVQAIMLHGRKNYWKVQEHVGSRTAYQIRSHAQKYFAKVELALGCLPNEDELAQLEGLNIPGMCAPEEEDPPENAYLSDTGAEITKAT